MSTALSETWKTAATSSRVRPATNAATARSRRASCADGDNCRASPTSSLTQGPTTQNTYRFGSIDLIPQVRIAASPIPDIDLAPALAELRRRLAVFTRRRIDAGLFTPLPPLACLTAVQPDKRPVLPIVKLLQIRYLADRPLDALRCMSQTRRGIRCPHPVLDPAAPSGVWTLTTVSSDKGQLTLSAEHLVLYNLNRAPYAEQLRWRAQRCPPTFSSRSPARRGGIFGTSTKA